MDPKSDYYWHDAEFDAAIIQTEEYLMRGEITTDLYEVAEDVADFLQTGYIISQNTFFVTGSHTIH